MVLLGFLWQLQKAVPSRLGEVVDLRNTQKQIQKIRKLKRQENMFQMKDKTSEAINEMQMDKQPDKELKVIVI